MFGCEEGNLALRAEAWKKGFDLSEYIKMKAINPVVKDDMLSAEVMADGPYVNKGNKRFAISRCNPNGSCITALVVVPVQFYDAVKNTAIQFMSSSSFQPPSNASPYADFDWQDFLSNKVLVTFASVQGGSKETMIHLCKDGSFTATIKKKGFFKNQNPDYKGTLTGLWTAKGDGEKATMQFIFKNKSISPVEVLFTIKDEKVMSDGERYFVGNSDKCK